MILKAAALACALCAPAADTAKHAPALSTPNDAQLIQVANIDRLDVGDGVFIQGIFADEPAYVVRIDRRANWVKVQRRTDGTTTWVRPAEIISREQSTANNVGRAAVTVAIFVCIVSPDACSK